VVGNPAYAGAATHQRSLAQHPTTTTGNQRTQLSKFQLDVLENCESAKAVLISKEQYYFYLYRPNYNILKTAVGCYASAATTTLGFKHTE
jgi:hypothetical protein